MTTSLLIPEHRVEKTENKTKDKQLKELVEFAEENKPERESPHQGKTLRHQINARTPKMGHDRRTNQINKGISGNINDTQNVDEKQLVRAEDDQRLDDSDPSKRKNGEENVVGDGE